MKLRVNCGPELKNFLHRHGVQVDEAIEPEHVRNSRIPSSSLIHLLSARDARKVDLPFAESCHQLARARHIDTAKGYLRAVRRTVLRVDGAVQCAIYVHDCSRLRYQSRVACSLALLCPPSSVLS